MDGPGRCVYGGSLLVFCLSGTHLRRKFKELVERLNNRSTIRCSISCSIIQFNHIQIIYTDPLYLVCCYKKRFVYIDPTSHRVLLGIQVFLATVGAPPGGRHRRDHAMGFTTVDVRPPIARGTAIVLGLIRSVAGHAGQRECAGFLRAVGTAVGGSAEPAE